MRGSKCLVGAAALAVLVVSPASAGKRSSRQVRLALVPIQAQQIGGWLGKHLPLAHDSGPVSNAEAARMSFTGSPSMFRKLGRLGGYTLDYGAAFSALESTTTQVQTYVEQYKTAADASRGLAFWKRDDAQVTSLNVGEGFNVDAFRPVRVPAVGTRDFAYFTEFNPRTVARVVQMYDERFTDGRYVLEVRVAGGTGGGPYGPSGWAKVLDRRLHLALSGRSRATAAKLPPALMPGPAQGAPDLSTLVLQPSDFAGDATALSSKYFVDRLALSAYGIDYQPAGTTYDLLRQEVEWYATRNEAAFRSAYDEALDTARRGTGGQTTTVNLDSISYGERATVTRVSTTGGTLSIVVIGLSRGQAKDVVIAESHAEIQSADVQSLAHVMANRLDALSCQPCLRRR